VAVRNARCCAKGVKVRCGIYAVREGAAEGDFRLGYGTEQLVQDTVCNQKQLKVVSPVDARRPILRATAR